MTEALEIEQQGRFTAARLLWAFLAGEDTWEAEWREAWNELHACDTPDQAGEDMVVAVLIGWLAECMQHEGDALERARVEVWRSAPAQARFEALIGMRQAPWAPAA
jgi:hypothetical protein